MQYAVGYGPIRLRSAIIPVTQIGSKFSLHFAAGWACCFTASRCFWWAFVLFSLTTVFQLVTLPVEFNASHRALETH